MAVPMPTRIPSCFDRSQWVITILSLQLSASCCPPMPAILASRDCANVSVRNGREGDGGERVPRRDSTKVRANAMFFSCLHALRHV